MIRIIHHKRTTGKPNTVYVGRPSVLGNPFTHLAKSTAADVLVSTPNEAVERYEEWLDEQVDNGNEGIIQALTDIMNLELEHGVVHLSCWCKDELNPFSTDREFCHADVIRNFILDEIDAANAEEQ